MLPTPRISDTGWLDGLLGQQLRPMALYLREGRNTKGL
jgi:hypothetical protein